MTFGQKVKKLIKQALKPFAEQKNFLFYKPTVLLRVHQNVMHVISFQLPGTSGFYCYAVIQPLYIPYERLDLSFGGRLRHMTNNRDAWGLEIEDVELEREFEQLLEVINKNALPWFDQAGCPAGIVPYVNQWAPGDAFLIAPITRKRHLAYSYLYLNELELADKALSAFLEEGTQPPIYDYQEVENNRIQELRKLIQSQPEMIGDKIREYIDYTSSHLKLDLRRWV